MLEDHAFEQDLDDLLFFRRELGNSFKLQKQFPIWAEFIDIEDQHICAHLVDKKSLKKHADALAHVKEAIYERPLTILTRLTKTSPSLFSKMKDKSTPESREKLFARMRAPRRK